MKISLSSLQTFLDLDRTVSEIEEALVLLGIEVDGIENKTASFSHVVVGNILSVEKHPQADRLKVAKVTDGKETFQIVCGAPNCRANMKVAFAKIGAELTDENGKVFKIKKSKLRQVESYGMLCSASELRLFEEHEGILELPDSFKEGEDLSTSLVDPIFEISLTPNLGHCASALGVARELSAFFKIPMKPFQPVVHTDTAPSHLQIKIENHALCSRYTCRLIENVTVAPSPFWLQKALLQCGIRSVNNIVDITNFVMLELGQPMHAFDFDQIEGDTIWIQENDEKQKLLALDGNTYALPKDSLLISDQEKPLAIAGVMGLENSAVHFETKNVLLEAACFDPISVRKTSKALNLRTESSQRFEKGTDPEMASLAIDRATELFQDLGSSKNYPIIDCKKELPLKEIILRKDKVRSISGICLSLNEITQLLERLLFSITPIDPGTLKVSVPSFRNDITQEIDLIEEVIRIYGYNKIEKKPPTYTSTGLFHSPMYLLETHIRKKLIEQNLQEVLNADLISEELAANFQEIDLKKRNYIKALHSKSAEYSVLRPSLFMSLLQNIKHNLDRKNSDLSLFEIGKIHFREKNQYIEQTMASIALTGKRSPPFWDKEQKEVDFFDLKAILENLFETLYAQKIRFENGAHPSFHPTRQANLYQEGEQIGVIGELHPDLLTKMDIRQRVYFSEIHLSPFLKQLKNPIQMTPLALYPSSERDWTLFLSKKTPISDVFDAIDQFKPSILEDTFLLDLYEKQELQDQKNVTFRFIYRDSNRTLSYQEVEEAHTDLKEKISQHLKIAERI